MSTFLSAVQGGVRIRIQVQTNAPSSDIQGLHGDRIKVRIKSIPVDGKANEALIELFSEIFGVGKGFIKIIAGISARLKTVEILGIDIPAAQRILLSTTQS